jgi:hypothetical protein
MWGARGAFPPAAAKVVAVVTQVVLCAKATKKINKTLKLVVCQQKVYCKTYYNSYIANCSVVEPELWHVQSPNHFCPMDPDILGIVKKLVSLRE